MFFSDRENDLINLKKLIDQSTVKVKALNMKLQESTLKLKKYRSFSTPSGDITLLKWNFSENLKVIRFYYTDSIEVLDEATYSIKIFIRRGEEVLAYSDEQILKVLSSLALRELKKGKSPTCLDQTHLSVLLTSLLGHPFEEGEKIPDYSIEQILVAISESAVDLREAVKPFRNKVAALIGEIKEIEANSLNPNKRILGIISKSFDVWVWRKRIGASDQQLGQEILRNLIGIGKNIVYRANFFRAYIMGDNGLLAPPNDANPRGDEFNIINLKNSMDKWGAEKKDGPLMEIINASDIMGVVGAIVELEDLLTKDCIINDLSYDNFEDEKPKLRSIDDLNKSEETKALDPTIPNHLHLDAHKTRNDARKEERPSSTLDQPSAIKQPPTKSLE